jgi:hypothetical protein
MNVAKRRIPQALPLASEPTYLGPAQVVGRSTTHIEVEMPDGTRAMATPALAFTYEPAVGDTVLVISAGHPHPGARRDHYVIGVIATTGRGVVSFPGDLEVRSGGRLRLAGHDGVDIEGREMRLNVGKLEMVARTVTQRFESLKQRVTDLLSVHAGASQTMVDGTSHLRAKNASVLTEEKVTINGKAIHLG